MFTTNTLAFLSENRFMNSKDWFTAHKADYEKCVRQPLITLSEALAPTVSAIDPQLITDPKNAVSRIYCDLRYSKGMLYRETMWISFRRDRQAFPCWPEFFVVLSPKEFFYGCGYYSARADAMDAARQLILRGDESFRAALDAYRPQSSFAIEGDCYKRSRFPEQTPELREWLDRKSFCFAHRPQGFAELFADDLAERVSECWLMMKPIYDFLICAEMTAASVQ